MSLQKILFGCILILLKALEEVVGAHAKEYNINRIQKK